jgi:hypothetical protein
MKKKSMNYNNKPDNNDSIEDIKIDVSIANDSLFRSISEHNLSKSLDLGNMMLPNIKSLTNIQEGYFLDEKIDQ